MSLQLVHDQLMYSVTAEAAFNLSLIYRQPGQFDLERHYLLKHRVAWSLVVGSIFKLNLSYSLLFYEDFLRFYYSIYYF